MIVFVTLVLDRNDIYCCFPFNLCQTKDDQVVKLGLRTLEFWVDNLNPEYLYPHMCGGYGSNTLSTLMRSLCRLLRSEPASFGVTALHILGVYIFCSNFIGNATLFILFLSGAYFFYLIQLDFIYNYAPSNDHHNFTFLHTHTHFPLVRSQNLLPHSQ